MTAQRDTLGALAPAVDQFQKVTASYWPGLFHCYDVPDLPRTNNELEQYFGRARHHERRATGHKRPTSAVVVRGAVRVVAAVASQLRVWSGEALRPGSVAAWRQLRKELEVRHEARRAQRRFRRDPAASLAQLEARLCSLENDLTSFRALEPELRQIIAQIASKERSNAHTVH